MMDGQPPEPLRIAALAIVGPAHTTGDRLVAVAARGGERAGRPGVDEWLAADLEFPGGATGSARCNMAGEGVRMTCRIVGDRGEATAANFALPIKARRGAAPGSRRRGP